MFACRHTVNVSIGESKGQTVLPLPAAEPVQQPQQQQQGDGALKDKDKVHILESAVVTWTKQIKNVLKADPDAAFKVRASQRTWTFGTQPATIDL